jgi:hypothetical protein
MEKGEKHMRIISPPAELVVDGSLWNHHLKAAELLAGGVRHVVIGLYKYWDGTRYILHPNSQRLCEQAISGGLNLQTYFYYYPERDPVVEANWYVDMMLEKKYPVLFAWADCEAFKAVMDPNVRSEQNRRFCEQLGYRFPLMGLYAAKWYIDAYAPKMNDWIGEYAAWPSHYGRIPAAITKMSWQELRANWLPNYDILLAPGQVGKAVGHQFVGDRIVLPGLYDELGNAMTTDVSTFDKVFLDHLVPTPMPQPTMCNCCGQPLQVTPSVPVPPSVPANVYCAKPLHNPNVHAPWWDGPTIGILIEQNSRVVVDIETEPYYYHFTPTAQFPQGGWVYKAYMQKV